MREAANQAWYLARASGIVAWVLLGASALWGSLLATRVFGRRPTAPWLLDMHQYMSGVALGLTAVHIVGLIADNYVHFDVADVLIPLSSGWRPGPVAWGVVALYLLVLVEVTSLLRRRLSLRLWRTLHLLSYPAWAVASIHFLSAGTDSRRVLGAPVAVGLGGLVLVVAVLGLLHSVRTVRRARAASFSS